MPETPRAALQALSGLTGAWTLDPRRTTIQFHTKAMWVLNVSGTFRATEGSGAVDDNGHVTGRLVIDTHSIDTKNKRRDAHLRNADFFEVQEHPLMVFDVTGASLGAHGQGTVAGTLSIRGVTQPVELQATLRTEGGGAVTLDAQTEIDRSKWGMSWAMMGAGLINHVAITATFVRS
jgi:polyisoprenoid-binding protein YceI